MENNTRGHIEEIHLEEYLLSRVNFNELFENFGDFINLRTFNANLQLTLNKPLTITHEKNILKTFNELKHFTNCKLHIHGVSISREDLIKILPWNPTLLNVDLQLNEFKVLRELNRQYSIL